MLEHWDGSNGNGQKPLFIVNNPSEFPATSLNRLVVRMFAGARERVGVEFIEIEVNLPISVTHLKETIAINFESLRSFVEFGRIAINNDFVCDSDHIDKSHSQSVIALIPPVSGG